MWHLSYFYLLVKCFFLCTGVVLQQAIYALRNTLKRKGNIKERKQWKRSLRLVSPRLPLPNSRSVEETDDTPPLTAIMCDDVDRTGNPPQPQRFRCRCNTRSQQAGSGQYHDVVDSVTYRRSAASAMPTQWAWYQR